MSYAAKLSLPPPPKPKQHSSITAMPRIEIRVITDLHKDVIIIYRNAAYKHKFIYLKRKINESVGISPFRQILTLNLPGGDNRVIEGAKLNHKFSMYYTRGKEFLENHFNCDS